MRNYNLPDLAMIILLHFKIALLLCLFYDKCLEDGSDDCDI